MNKYICIHGHFYQPPRENAWLEEIELQDSAFPYHDWNQRINKECYRPNTSSRILDNQGVINNILNNYSKISFNFGPTLLSWLEAKDKDTYQKILEADKLSMEYFDGHGSALAQAYNHMILPLSNRNDKETQVKWGIEDFIHRFGRKPEGMWLAETAVDTETLQILADNGIKFTILAPSQAKSFRKRGDSKWTNVSEGKINTQTPYLVNLPDGKQISIFFYDDETSQAVAFNHLLSNGKDFANKLLDGLNDNSHETQLVNIATDGESYGHHHKHGDMALAFCLDFIENSKTADLINYGAFLEKFPPQYEAEIFENSSWSCAHGVQRWVSNCGCQTGGKEGWNQDWRQPLRNSLDWLRDQAADIYLKESEGLFTDAWEARNKFIKVINDRGNGPVKEFLSTVAGVELSEKERIKALRLLEMQRHSMLMYTSCGWFFSDISGLETVQILQYACRVLQLAKQVGGVDLEPGFLSILDRAKSNIEEMGNGVDIYKKYAATTRIDLMEVGMHYAASSIFEDDPESFPVFNYLTESKFFDRQEAGVQKLAVGITNVKSITTHSGETFCFAVLYLGQNHIIGNISFDMNEGEFKQMHKQINKAFNESRVADVIGIMQSYFGPGKFTIWHLFKDEKRKVLDQIISRNLRQVENSFNKIYNRDYQLLNALKKDNIPIPKVYKTTFEYVLNQELKRVLEDGIDSRKLKRLAEEFEKWDIQLSESLSFSLLAGDSMYKSLNQLYQDPGNLKLLKNLTSSFEILKKLKIDPDLHQSQNLYFSLARLNGKAVGDLANDPEWNSAFEKLGDKIGVKLH